MADFVFEDLALKTLLHTPCTHWTVSTMAYR